MQAAVLVAGQVHHRGHRPVRLRRPAGAPDVLVHPKRAHPGQPIRSTRARGRLDLHRPPQGVPVHPQMPGQRRDRGVVVGQRIGRPLDRPGGEHGPRRDQLMLLRPGPGRAVRLGAAPDPLQPDDQDRHAEARRVRREYSAPAMTDRDDATAPAAGHVGAGLDGDNQLAVTVPHVEHVHGLDVEHRISPSAPACTRTTPTVSHVGVFFDRLAWPLPILETPTLISLLRHAAAVTHAQIRRAGYAALRDEAWAPGSDPCRALSLRRVRKRGVVAVCSCGGEQ